MGSDSMFIFSSKYHGSEDGKGLKYMAYKDTVFIPNSVYVLHSTIVKN